MNRPFAYQELIAALEHSAIEYQFEPDFKGSGRILKGATGRIVWAESRSMRGDLYGISFWIHKGKFCWHLGLWSGKLYQTNCSTKELSLIITELFSGSVLPSGATPSSFPEDFMIKYSISRAN